MKNHAVALAASILLAAALAAPLRADAPAAPVPAPNKVLVIPFLTLNVGPDQQWIGKAVEETIVADLGRTPNYSPVSFSGQTIVEDNGSAARIARESSIPFAVRGAAQEVNGEIRLTAQLIDAKSADTLTTAIATGPANSLLKLEDQLAAQLTGQPAPLATTALKAPAPPVAPQAPLAPAVTTPQEAYVPPPTIVYNPQPAYTPAEPVYQSYPAYTQPDYNYVQPVYVPSYDDYAPGYSGIYFYSSPSYYRSYPRSYGGIHFGGGGYSGGIHTGGGYGGGTHFGGGSHGGGRR